MYDVIIIGAGPAGLSAAVYASRAGLSAVLLEQGAAEGGQVLLADMVDNYLGIPDISGYELGNRFRAHAVQMGIPIERKEAVQVKKTEEGWEVCMRDKSRMRSRAVILAMGAEHLPLGVPGEREYIGKGVSYCASCDGTFFRGKTAAVVGGGNTAVGDALILSRLCRKVYLIHRRDSLRASAALQERLFACKNVELLWNSTAERILGEKTVTGICIRTRLNRAAQMQGEKQGEKPEEKQEQEEKQKQQKQEGKQDGELRRLAVDGVFVAVGRKPRTEMVQTMLACDAKGYICAGEDCRTSVPGILAAGDLRTKPVRQIVTAAADGAAAVAALTTR